MKQLLGWAAIILLCWLCDIIFGNGIEEDIKEIKKMLKEKNG